MPKYRLLSNDELQQFEKEFIEFLVVNGIEPDRWGKIKENDQASVDKIIELFSDVILESVLRNIKFIQIKSRSYVQAIQCLEDRMISIAIEDEKFKSTAKEKETTESSLNLFKTERAYIGNRETDLFDMLQKGYEISDGTLFAKLQAAGN